MIHVPSLQGCKHGAFLRILLSSMLLVLPEVPKSSECYVPKRGKIFKRGCKSKLGEEPKAKDRQEKEGKPESCIALRVKGRTR